jgi:urease accessory protein
VFTSTFGGGLVDRDHISMEIDIGAGAMALVSTQASTKVYRSRHGTVSTVHARIASGALLALLPDPVVCFANARYRQEQRFDLADDANLVVVDWMTAGRRAAGERWLFDEYVARLFVSHGRRRLVHDVLALRAEDGDVSSRLGRYDVVAIAVMVGPAIAAEAGRIVTQLGAAPIVRCADQLIAASPIAGGGVVRVAGRSVEQVAAVLRAHLGFVRTLLGDDPWARKW